jgi:hypothetical protein
MQGNPYALLPLLRHPVNATTLPVYFVPTEIDSVVAATKALLVFVCRWCGVAD